MHYPNFYTNIPTITLEDKLSTFLGAFEDGIIEFSYLDIVKSAGHSCPTVLGAYLSTLKALEFLYKDEIPKRGEIRVEFQEAREVGVTGVIASVIQNIIGATANFGFKGISGNFDRRNLMFFEKEIDSSLKFTRIDTNKSVEITYNPNHIPPHEDMQGLMKKMIIKVATDEEKIEFGKLWQQRVEDISNNINKVITVN